MRLKLRQFVAVTAGVVLPATVAQAMPASSASRIEIFNSEFHIETPQTSVVAIKRLDQWTAHVKCSGSVRCKPAQSRERYLKVSNDRISELASGICAKGSYENRRPIVEATEGFSAKLVCDGKTVSVFDMDGKSDVAQLYRILLTKE